MDNERFTLGLAMGGENQANILISLQMVKCKCGIDERKGTLRRERERKRKKTRISISSQLMEEAAPGERRSSNNNSSSNNCNCKCNFKFGLFIKSEF